MTSSPGAGGPITKAIIITVDNKGGDISTCDVSGITDMSYLFSGGNRYRPEGCIGQPRLGPWCDESAQNVNQDISTWDASNVTDMSEMFNTASFNNGGVGSLTWSDTSKVTSMRGMFSQVGGLTSVTLLDTSSVTDMCKNFFWQVLVHPLTSTKIFAILTLVVYRILITCS